MDFRTWFETTAISGTGTGIGIDYPEPPEDEDDGSNDCDKCFAAVKKSLSGIWGSVVWKYCKDHITEFKINFEEDLLPYGEEQEPQVKVVPFERGSTGLEKYGNIILSRMWEYEKDPKKGTARNFRQAMVKGIPAGLWDALKLKPKEILNCQRCEPFIDQVISHFLKFYKGHYLHLYEDIKTNHQIIKEFIENPWGMEPWHGWGHLPGSGAYDYKSITIGRNPKLQGDLMTSGFGTDKYWGEIRLAAEVVYPYKVPYKKDYKPGKRPPAKTTPYGREEIDRILKRK